MAENKIITRVLASVQQLDAQTWNVLLASQSTPTPFMRHEYLAAMEQSGSATPDTGWIARVITVWDGDELLAACPLYIKTHSYGEYVFDWAWARAYQQHGLPYYPKGLLAVPFTPVPGSRLLARSQALRVALVHAVQAWAAEQQLSSLHLLFGDADDLAACAAAGWMQRSTVQFTGRHTPRRAPGQTAAPALRQTPSRWKDFDDFLGSLNQEKRKKIRQERRKIAKPA
jgi:predicted N-acyltransferase